MMYNTAVSPLVFRTWCFFHGFTSRSVSEQNNEAAAFTKDAFTDTQMYVIGLNIWSVYCTHQTLDNRCLITCYHLINMHFHTHKPGTVGISPPLISPTSLTGRSPAVSSTTGDITPSHPKCTKTLVFEISQQPTCHYEAHWCSQAPERKYRL